MIRVCRLVAILGLGLALAPSVAALAATPGPTPPPPMPGPSSLVTALSADIAAPASAPAFAVALRGGCKSNCTTLLRTTDAGHSWGPVAATGWNGSQPVVITASGRQLVAAPGSGGVVVSSDAGRTFAPAPGGATGAVDLIQAPGGVDALGISPTGSGAVLFHLLSGAVQPLPAPSLDHPAYSFTGDLSMPALLSGTDHNTGVPIVQQCSASYTCSGSAQVVPHPDGARLWVSPHFAEDRTVFATTSRGLLVSTDAGRSFRAILILTPANTPGLVIQSIPAVALTPDFDLARHTGRVIAAVFAVAGGQNGQPTKTVGGVYGSADTSAWSKLGGSSALDGGVQALALIADRRLVAAYAGGQQAGTLCLVDGGSAWQSTCPGSSGPGTTAAGAVPAHLSPQGGTTGAVAPTPGATSASDASAAPTGGGGASHNTRPAAAQASGIIPWRVVGPALLAVALAIGAVVRRRGRWAGGRSRSQ